MTADPQRLEFIFGAESSGGTPQQRAETSKRIYVRSQTQLAFDSEAAKGRKLTAAEALAAFDLATLEKVAEDGAAGLVSDPAQPADTFKKRRKFLNLSEKSLADAAEVSAEEVKRAETAGTISPIRNLERIAQALALDERTLGFEAEALGDKKLGARLRDLNPTYERDDSFITTLADAAWVIGRQMELSRWLNADERLIGKFAMKLNDYKKPAYRTGYELAEKTRILLGLSELEPIENVRRLIEERIGIPVVDTDLGPTIAGATIINGRYRGIALGTAPGSRRTLVMRMTLAHELGHLLWDPESVLERVRIERADEMGRKQGDPVEIRANAFGIALLAPRAAVQALYDEFRSPDRTVGEMVARYGISQSAAVNHLKTVCEPRLTKVEHRISEQVYRKWDQLERQPGKRLKNIPMGRRGRFADLVLQAAGKGLITSDSAGSWLRVDPAELDL